MEMTLEEPCLRRASDELMDGWRAARPGPGPSGAAQPGLIGLYGRGGGGGWPGGRGGTVHTGRGKGLTTARGHKVGEVGPLMGGLGGYDGTVDFRKANLPPSGSEQHEVLSFGSI